MFKGKKSIKNTYYLLIITCSQTEGKTPSSFLAVRPIRYEKKKKPANLIIPAANISGFFLAWEVDTLSTTKTMWIYIQTAIKY